MEHQHVTLRFADGRAICPDEPSALYLARLVSAVGADHGLLAWRAREKRIELLFGPDRHTAGQAARRIAIGAQQVLGAGSHFARAAIKPVSSLTRVGAIFDQLLLDAEHPLVTASSLPDAVGVRGLAPYARGSLERCTRRPRLLLPCDRPLMAVADWAYLAESTAAVFGHADLRRRFRWRSSALSAAGSLAFPEIGPSMLARLLGVSRSTMGRALDRPASRPLRRMIEAQLRWRSVLVRSGAR